MLSPLASVFNRTPLVGHTLALVSGALMPLSFAPFDLWPIGILSLVIFLLCIHGERRAHIVIRFYLYYLGMFALGVNWIFVSINVYGGASTEFAVFLVSLIVIAWSATGLVHGYLYSRFVAQLPLGLLLGFPILWMLSELFRTWFMTGFPWLLLGYGHLASPLAGYAPLLGVYGLSLAVALTAVLLFLLVTTRKPILIALIFTLWGSGYLLQQVTFVTEQRQISVVAVQGNIDQHTKWRREMVVPIFNKYLSLTENEWGADLIVWPEASVTLLREHADNMLQELDATGEKFGSTLVLGIPDRDQSGNMYNTAIAIGQGEGIYRKRHLVPFGEYVPFENWLRGVIAFFDLPMSHNHSGSPEQKPLQAGALTLSLSICYEVVFQELVRTTASSPDLLVTISNDTWFGTSIGPNQHLQIAQMRALENGRYLLRTTNNGITALVNHKGEIVESLPQFQAGVLKGTAGIMSGNTPFHRFGQLPLLIVSLLVLFGQSCWQAIFTPKEST